MVGPWLVADASVVERQLTLQHQWKFLEIFYRISRKEKRTRKMTHKTVFVFAFCVLFFAIDVESKPRKSEILNTPLILFTSICNELKGPKIISNQYPF